jgi:hypothetical protein
VCPRDYSEFLFHGTQFGTLPTHVAAATVFMAHKLDSRYIGGLQIWYYSNGAWTFRDNDQCGPLSSAC